MTCIDWKGIKHFWVEMVTSDASEKHQNLLLRKGSSERVRLWDGWD